MEQHSDEKKRSPSRQLVTIALIAAFAVIGAVLGIVAYHQHWLG